MSTSLDYGINLLREHEGRSEVPTKTTEGNIPQQAVG